MNQWAVPTGQMENIPCGLVSTWLIKMTYPNQLQATYSGLSKYMYVQTLHETT